MLRSSENKQPPCKPMPRHKLAALTFLGLLVPVYVIPKLLLGIFPDQPVMATMLTVGTIVALMTYIIMPALVWAFRGWIMSER